MLAPQSSFAPVVERATQKMLSDLGDLEVSG
jgi:hypothetical protein